MGSSFHHPGDVRLRQPGGTDLTYERVHWASRSFELPLYYGIRLTHFFGARPGWGLLLDFLHDKAYADTGRTARVCRTRQGVAVDGREPLGASVQSFSLSHGVNDLTLGVAYRWNASPGEQQGCVLQPYAGGGLGLLIPHVEARLSEQETGAYQLAGPVFQVLGGVRATLLGPLGLMAEYRLTYTAPTLQVPGGELTPHLLSHHLVGGASIRLPLP